MKTEEQVYNDVLNYINSNKHNRPCTLASIKKQLRSQRVVDLIFSRPDIFKLALEFSHVPTECITESIIVKYILSDPYNLNSIDESLQTLPVIVAFEFSKRRFELISRLQWGSYGVKIPYPEKVNESIKNISKICNDIAEKISENPDNRYMIHNYLEYIQTVSNVILEHCKLLNKEVEKEEKYIAKYLDVEFNLGNKLCIFVSGLPDAGKTTFSNALTYRIKNSIHLDSDELLKKELLCLPLKHLTKAATVTIISDPDASRLFSQREIEEAHTIVINILVKPSSIETMHRYAKYLANIPFDEYKRNQVDRYNYNYLINPIVVTNDYTGHMGIELDRAIEEIIKRLEISLGHNESILFKEQETNQQCLKRVLKPKITPTDN